MKTKRSERLIDMTYYLLEHPHRLISLTYFSEKYGSAKSSISEDLSILKRTMQKNGLGSLKTSSGANGGVIFLPKISATEARETILMLCERMSEEGRLLPGGYVYLSDLLGESNILKKAGRIIASLYAEEKIDAVMTVATKGVPIAQAVSSYLNVPFVIVRRDSKITEGATVSVNYVSGSSARVEKMELSKRSLASRRRILVVDDFMKGGGTIQGMLSLIEEFNATCVGVCVFAESKFKGERTVKDFDSLLFVEDVDIRTKTIKVIPGTCFDKIKD